MGKYFVSLKEVKNSWSYEFYKGKWDGHTFWKSDSILLHDDVMTDGFVQAIMEVIPSYDPFEITEVSILEWQEIGKRILSNDIITQEQYKEANEWLEDVFQKYTCFTILGI